MGKDGKMVLVGMSGGVDSSVAVCLLQEQGFQVQGATLRLWEGACSGDESVRDAAQAAQRLGVPHLVWEDQARFRREVLDYFAQSYYQGLTPNPCVRCNRQVKFPGLLEAAAAQGAQYVATGHYARVEPLGSRFLLKKGADRRKDQSYFLYALSQEQLAHTLFPLGGLEKVQVREIAQAHGLTNAGKRDSQDICFVPDGDYVRFLEEHTGQVCPPGDFLDETGRVLGRHQGHVRYTLGQRRGLAVALGERTYVVGKDPQANTVTLGTNAQLFTEQAMVSGLNFVACDDLEQSQRLTVKTRYTQTEVACTVQQTGPDRLTVTFDQPQRAVTPGQALVLYDGDTVVAGGTIVG